MSKNLNILQKAVAKPVVLILSLVLVATFIFIPTLVTADESTIPAETADGTASADPDAVGEETADPSGKTVPPESTADIASAETVPPEAGATAPHSGIAPESTAPISPAEATAPAIERPSTALTNVTSFPAFTVNATTNAIGIAGQQWLVIGKNITGQGIAEGVNSAGVNTLTLLLSDKGQTFSASSDSAISNNPYGVSAFRTGAVDFFADSTLFDNLYYANNPVTIGNVTGIGAWTNPNEYLGSTLHQKMYELYTSTGGFLAKEQTQILTRELPKMTGYSNDNTYPLTRTVPGQYLWPLSYGEWNNAVKSTSAGRFGGSGWYWLRSPYNYNTYNAMVGDGCGSGSLNSNVYYSYGVRPAFTLDLASVIFTSVASGASSPDEIALQTPVDITASWSAIADPKKFTFSDESLTLSLSAATNPSVGDDMSLTIGGVNGVTEDLTINYENATPGKRISCLLVNKDAGASYYENLTTDSAVSGAVTLKTAGIDEGNYTLQIFTEEANGEDKSNFCSVPAAFDYAGLVSVAGEAITATGDGTTTSAPKTASITVASAQESISLAEIIPAARGTATLYTGSGFTDTAPAVALTAGFADNHLYIAVTAPAGDTLYYDVTVYRPISIYPVIKHFDTWTGAGTAYAKIDAPSAKFVALYCGEAQVDPADYKVAEGSTIITLSKRCLKGFSNGTYRFVATYTDGHSADITLKVDLTDDSTNGTDDIDDPSKSGSKSGSSDTGDDFGIGLLSGTLLLAAAGLIACVIARRRIGRHA
jgi:hypothetical protein